MTRDQLLAKLRSLDKDWDTRIHGDSPYEWHLSADEALLAYINDPEVTEAFEKIERWYS